MDKYKFVVDILSSLASLIAIITVFWAWMSSKRNALKIKRVVIHQSEQTSNFILEIENSKPYPVEIKNTRCFTKPNYKVEQVNNCFPSFHKAYSLTDSPFLSDERHTIEANGFTDIRFNKGSNLESVKELTFLMDTSHGYHSLKCKNITLVKMGAQTFGMEAMEEYDSRASAVKKYCSLTIRRVWNILKEKLTRRLKRN
jgi:hypothetical protein